MKIKGLAGKLKEVFLGKSEDYSSIIIMDGVVTRCDNKETERRMVEGRKLIFEGSYEELDSYIQKEETRLAQMEKRCEESRGEYMRALGRVHRFLDRNPLLKEVIRYEVHLRCTGFESSLYPDGF
jgi:hypothetical protein